MNTLLLRRFTDLSVALTQRPNRARRRGDAGMTTAEYAVGTLAACAFAALLFVVVKDTSVRKTIVDVVLSALRTKG